MSGPGTQRQKLTIRAWRGTCVLCKHDLFDGDDISRGRGQLLGAVHTDCLKRWEAKEGK